MRMFSIVIVLGAFTSFGSPVIKTISSLCDSPATSKRVGSGVVFKSLREYFVVTSSHVALHELNGKNVCHEIENDAKQYSMRLIAADFTQGLALFGIEAPPSLEAISWDEGSFEYQPKSPVFIAGIPYDSKSLFPNNEAKVLNFASNRTILPNVQSVIEFEGHSEFGMSGGALLQDKKFVGLISHQYLAFDKAGAVPKVFEQQPSPASHRVIVGLAIPGAQVRRWMSKAFKNPNEAHFPEPLKSQLDSEKQFFDLGGLRLEQGRQSSGDGVGIGGTPSSAKAAKDRSAQIELSISHSDTTWPFSKADWFIAAKKKLRSGYKLAITGLEKDGIRYELPDLVSTFALIERGYYPLMRVIEAPLDNIDSTRLKLAEMGSQLATLAQDFEETVESGPLLDQLALIAEKLEGHQFELISEAALDGIIKPIESSSIHRAWLLLFNQDFEKAVVLKSLLLNTRELLRKVRVR